MATARSNGHFYQETRQRRKLCRQRQQDRDNKWTPKAKMFEKAWRDKKPRKAHALIKQYRGSMKRCAPILNNANGVALGEAILPIWRNHCKALLNRQKPSALKIKLVHRPTYAITDRIGGSRLYPKDEKWKT
ncbi:hypothetical protein RB195_003345 [Necator americanus]|uniref:Uncharacterized protein n=1 Tax=Necator americanus TaxID=51031 RepID=A0ABR1DN42_NECAM